MKFNNIRYQVLGSVFMMIYFHPTADENIYKKIIYVIILFLFFVDIVKYLVSNFKQAYKKDEKSK